MTTPSSAELHLIGDIYDAAMDPTLWASVIRQLADLAQAEQANVLAFDQLNPDYFLFHSHGVRPENLKRYQDGGFAALDMEFAGKWMLSQGGIGAVVANHKHPGGVANYIREAGRLYHEFFAKVGVHYQCGSLMEKTDYRWSVLGLHRSEHGTPFEEPVLAALGRLIPHLRRALQIHRQLTTVRRENAQLYRILDSFAAGVLLLDGQERIRYANPRAEQLLKHSELEVTAHHGLRDKNAARNAVLQQVIQGAMQVSQRQWGALMSGGVLTCPANADGTSLMLTVTPLSELAGYSELRSDGIAAAIFMTDPLAQQRLSRRLLRETYALSERECDLCEAFINRATLEGVAEACGLTLASVRTYLKAVYDKTGQRSQAELMRLLMGLRLDFEHIP